MKKTLEEFKAHIRDLIDTYENHNYKENALNELKEVETSMNKVFPNIAFVLEQYPNFNCITLRVTQEGCWRIQFDFNPSTVKELNEAQRELYIDGLAMTMYEWYLRGAEEGE